MRPLELRARNLRTWEDLVLVLPEGVAAVVGENGAGKSTLVQAIDLALFAGRGELARQMTRGAAEAWVQLMFQHRGAVYRVRRSYEAKGAGKPRLDLERLAGLAEAPGGPEWEPLTRETIAATEELLEELLGLSRATFRASSYLAQGEGDAFTAARPAERKAILLEALGVRLWDELRARAAADLRVDEQQVAKLVGRCDDLRAEAELAGGAQAALDGARFKALEKRGSLADLEAGLEARREEYTQESAGAAEAEATAQELGRLRQQQAAAGDRYRRIQELGQRGTELRHALELAHALAALEPRLRLYSEARQDMPRRHAAEEQASRELVQAREAERLESSRADQWVERVAEVEQQLAGDDDARCHACGQELAGAALERWVQERRRERAEWETERDKAVTRAQELATRVATLELVHEEAAGAVQAVQAKLDELEGRQPPLPAHALEHPVEAYADTQRAATEVVRLEQVLAQAPTEEEVAAAAQEAEELGRQVYRAEQAAEAGAAAREAAARAQRAVVDAQNKLVGARGELEQLDREVARYEATLERYEKAGEEAVVAEAMLAGARERVATLELAVRAYGRDGVPALILEAAALPQLEAEANRLVGELGRPYRFELRSTRTTQAGEQREALDIVVHTESGEAAYEEFSGGERTRLDLALRIALARLLAARRGADVQLLAIDEPAYLDAEGFHRLAGALRSLAGEFGTVLVVSHVAELRDAFDQVLEVVGGADTGEPSRLQEEVGA